MLRALSLPFLLSIPSERNLGEAIREEPLRSLCGFTSALPTRSTLWHFRNKHHGPLKSILTRCLVSMYITAVQYGIRLPFVGIPITGESVPWHDLTTIPIGRDGSVARLWPLRQRIESDEMVGQVKSMLPPTGTETRRRKTDISEFLDLPLLVRLEPNGSASHEVIIKPPPWLNSIRARSLVGTDSIRNLGWVQKPFPQTACSIIVTRPDSDEHLQILMAIRLEGFGRGNYALPGGKAQVGESPKRCAERELRQETGLQLIESVPVSAKWTNFKNQPPTWSIGVLAKSFGGIPRSREDGKHGPWEWHDIKMLPQPLFEPSRLILDDFRKGTYTGLEWENLEYKEIEQNPQLTLFSPA